MSANPPTSPPIERRRGRFQPGQVLDLSLSGALGAVFGLYLYGELSRFSASLATATALWWLRDILAGLSIGGAIGFFLNAAGPWRDGAYVKLAREAAWGALVGALGGACGLIAGELVLGGLRGGLVGRATSWAILGLGIGVSQAIAHRSLQRLRFGVLGGLLGGFVGGLLFEAFRERLGSGGYDPAVSQGLGIVILGAGLGLFLALVEQALRRAWVQVQSGRQEGRAYLLAPGGNSLGLDEKATVGLFGDSAIARQHAVIEAHDDGRFVLRPLDLTRTTRLNGRELAAPAPLNSGDRIQLGNTLLFFHCRGTHNG